jgi:hypothetical protein
MRQAVIRGFALAILVALIQYSTLSAQPGQTGVAGLTFPPPLYRFDGVPQTMQLTKQQIEQLDKVSEDLRSRTERQLRAANALSPQERAARVQQLNQQYQNEWSKAARAALNENQFNRYRQLQYQYGGFESLNDPDLQRRLSLTEQQRQAINDSIAWRQQQLNTINRLGVDRDNATRAWREFQKQHQERFNRFLTPEQQRMWRDVTGEPYQFSPYFPQR